MAGRAAHRGSARRRAAPALGGCKAARRAGRRLGWRRRRRMATCHDAGAAGSPARPAEPHRMAKSDDVVSTCRSWLAHSSLGGKRPATTGAAMHIDWNGQTADDSRTRDQLRARRQGPAGGLPARLAGVQALVAAQSRPCLAEHFDCIAPDLRGFGRTVSKVARTAEGTPPQLLAKDLRDFADALGLDTFAIVSHDVGSFVAQQFALAWPERVTKLFFFNCAYPGIGQRWGEFRHFPETWYQQFHQKDFAAALVGSSREACRIYFRHFLTHWCHQKAAFDALSRGVGRQLHAAGQPAGRLRLVCRRVQVAPAHDAGGRAANAEDQGARPMCCGAPTILCCASISPTSSATISRP